MADQETYNEQLHDQLAGILQEQQRIALETAKKMTNALKLLADQKDMDKHVYRITLTSLWADDGEKPVTVTKTGAIQDLIREAKDEFMRVNNRNDVQGRYSVKIVLGGLMGAFAEVELPQIYWQRYI